MTALRWCTVAGLVLFIGGCQQEGTTPSAKVPTVPSPRPAADGTPLRDLSGLGLKVQVALPPEVVFSPRFVPEVAPEPSSEEPSERKGVSPPPPVVLEAQVGTLKVQLEQLEPPSDGDLLRRDGEWAAQGNGRAPTDRGWALVAERAGAARYYEYRPDLRVLCTVDGLSSRPQFKDARKLCAGLR
jgi:hypothetical protein